MWWPVAVAVVVCGQWRWWWPEAMVARGGVPWRQWPEAAVVVVAGGRLPEVVVVVAEGHFCHLEGIHGRNGEIHHF